MNPQYVRRVEIAEIKREPSPLEQECYKCLTVKPADEFCKNMARKNGLNSLCRSCRSEAAKADTIRFAEDPEFRARQQAKNRVATLRRYGLTPETWDAELEAQGGKCKTCRADNPRNKNGWQTDHNHETGEFRGILCYFCNSVIGWIESDWLLPDPETYLRYLEGGL